ncbi:MAG: hypothetical protein U0694_00620 [Anaerolineae bacterium]
MTACWRATLDVHAGSILRSLALAVAAGRDDVYQKVASRARQPYELCLCRTPDLVHGDARLCCTSRSGGRASMRVDFEVSSDALLRVFGWRIQSVLISATPSRLHDPAVYRVLEAASASIGGCCRMAERNAIDAVAPASDAHRLAP